MEEKTIPQTTVGDATKTMDSIMEMPPAPPLSSELPPTPAPPSPPTGGKKETRPPPPNVKGRVDEDGRPFDWDLHEVDKATGKARLRLDGCLTFKRGNNKKAREKSIVAEDPPQTDAQPEAKPTESEAAEDPIQRIGRAAALVNLFERGSTVILGNEWKLEEEERAGLVNATDLVFEKYGSLVLPPEGMLAVAMAGIVLTRISQPETQKRLGRIRDFLRRGVGRAPQPGAPEAREVKTVVVAQPPSSGASSSGSASSPAS